jgi:hypothetical protein
LDRKHPDELNSVLLAVRAPPGTIIEAPHTMQGQPKSMEKEEYEELMGYLNKKYSLFMNAEPPSGA